MRDPDCPVARCPADRPVAAGDHLTRLAPEQLLLVPAEQVALLAEEAVEDPGYTVGAAEMAQDHRSRPRPVDLPVRLLHGPLEPAFDFRPSVVERLGYRGAAAEAIHRLKQGVDGRIGHLVAVERTLGEARP